MMRTRLITSSIDRSTPGQSPFTNDIRKGISMSEQLRKEKEQLFLNAPPLHVAQVKVKKPKHKPLTREDWNDISKLTFRDAEGHEIVEVKILESFIGVKPYPVVVIMRTLTNDLIARQYTIEGKAEKMVDDFQIIKIEIIKIEEPEPPIDYEGIIKDLAVTRAFITYDGEYYAPILWVNVNSKRFCTGALQWEFDKIRGFDITFDMNTFYAFNEYLQLRKENRVPTVDEFGNIRSGVKS